MTRDSGFLDAKPTELADWPLRPDQARALEAYIDVLLRELHLSHWQVWIAADSECEETAHAMIFPTEGRYIAMLHLSKLFFSTTMGSLTEHMTHELLHLHHRDLTENVTRALKEGDHSVAWENLILGQLRADTEKMVDSLSYVLAPHLPQWDPAAYGWEP